MARKQTNKITGPMLSKGDKAKLASAELASMAKAKGVELSIDNDDALALAWAAGIKCEIFRSLSAHPLPTPAQAKACKGASVHVLSKGAAMVVDTNGREIRQHKGEAVNVCDIPTDASDHVRKLRRTVHDSARKAILRSVSTMIRTAARIAKAEAKAEDNKAKAEAKAKATK